MPTTRHTMLAPKKATEILNALLKEAAGLETEPFGSPSRDRWTTTVQGALERAFGRDDSIAANFRRAQGIIFKQGDSAENLRKADNEKLAAEVSVVQSAIQQLSWAIEGEERIEDPTDVSKSPTTMMIFMSHSSKDADLAKALINLLKSALGLSANQIRCSSVDGYRLPVGVNTESKLREEVKAAKVVIGLITPSSLTSHFVMFELGARWGAGLFLAPLLAGVDPSELKGPLGLLNALSADTQSKLIQFVEDISKQIEINAVLQMAEAVPRIELAQEDLPVKGAIQPIGQQTYDEGYNPLTYGLRMAR